jgi:hypothetical protein
MTIQAVRIAVGKQFGISEADAIAPANLSPEERTRLLDYTAQFVATHPNDFTPAQVAVAQKQVDAWGINTPLLDTSFDWGMLASEVGSNVLKAGESIAGVGNGILSVFKMGSWLIPVAAFVFVAIYLYKEYKK